MSSPYAYVPERGEIVWLDFHPQIGREQAGRRPAIVLSYLDYNDLSGLAVVCPITSKSKGYRFEVALPNGLPITGVVLADQIKSIDWRARNAAYICELPEDSYPDILSAVEDLIG